MSLEISADTILVKLYAGVTGISRRTDEEKEHRAGQTVETQRRVTTIVDNEAEATQAKKLLNVLRAIVAKHTTTVLNLSITTSGQLAAMRTELAPTQEAIEKHNATAQSHFVDRALVCAPINLRVDTAALTEVCRQISGELKAARAFFDLGLVSPDADLKAWKVPVSNWLVRTKGLDTLFPTVTGEMIKGALESVRELYKRVGDSCRAFEKAGQSPESALRSALGAVVAVPEALGLIDNAIGFTAITDSSALEASNATRSEGNSLEVH